MARHGCVQSCVKDDVHSNIDEARMNAVLFVCHYGPGRHHGSWGHIGDAEALERQSFRHCTAHEVVVVIVDQHLASDHGILGQHAVRRPTRGPSTIWNPGASTANPSLRQVDPVAQTTKSALTSRVLGAEFAVQVDLDISHLLNSSYPQSRTLSHVLRPGKVASRVMRPPWPLLRPTSL